MQTLPLIIAVLLYLSVIGYLGYKGYKDTKNAADYLVGGRNLHPYVMAMSYGATFISTSAIVGFGGVASLYGMSLLWLAAANILLGIFVAFVFFGRRTRRMGLILDAHTFPEFLGRRVGSRFVQWFGGLMIFILMPLYAAAVLIGAARLVEGLLHIPYIWAVAIFTVLVAAYVIMGGLKGVMYTEAVQGSMMLGGMLFLLVFVYVKLGGVVAAHEALTSIADRVPVFLKEMGHRGWTASPEPGSSLWWVIYSSLLMGVGIGSLAQPQLVVRYMTVKSSKELNRALVIGSVFILITVATPYIVGPLSNVYFVNTQGQIAIEVAGGNVDSVVPTLIRELMPSWFGILFMLVILSAAMSTLSSQFHTVGTAVSRDFYEQGLRKGKSLVGELRIARIGIAVSIVITVILALRLGGGIIARATAIFFVLMASGFLAPYTCALSWRRLTRKGTIAGILTGLTAAAFGFLFLHAKEASVFGLCRTLTGRPTLLGGVWGVIDPIVYALPLSITATLGISLITAVENQETVDRCFQGAYNRKSRTRQLTEV